MGRGVSDGNGAGVSEGAGVSVAMSVGVAELVSVGTGGVTVTVSGEKAVFVGGSVKARVGGVGVNVELQAIEARINRIGKMSVRLIANYVLLLPLISSTSKLFSLACKFKT